MSINCVELDALVVMKVIKHCKENLPDNVTGLLLGSDNGSTLEVTHSFPYRCRERKRCAVWRILRRVPVFFLCACAARARVAGRIAPR